MEHNICPNCNAVLDDNAAFCSNCGNRIDPEAPAYQQPVDQQPAYQQPMYQQPAYQQPVYQQPMYQQPMYQQPTGTRRANPCGIIGMVFGILAFSLLAIATVIIVAKYSDLRSQWWGEFYTFTDVAEDMLSHAEGLQIMVVFSFLFALPSLPLSIVGVCLRNRSKGTAATGLALSVICLLATLFFMSL